MASILSRRWTNSPLPGSKYLQYQLTKQFPNQLSFDIQQHEATKMATILQTIFSIPFFEFKMIVFWLNLSNFINFFYKVPNVITGSGNALLLLK